MPIIQTRIPFSDEFVPPALADREIEVMQIKIFLEPLLKNQHNPSSLFICGGVGTGKTTVTRSILLNIPPQILSRYVTIDAKATTHAIASKIARAFFEEIPTYARFWSNIINDLIERIRTPALLLLDEIDKTAINEISPILHTLSRRGNITMLLMSRKPTALNEIPEDTRSSMKCREFCFPPYTKEQLVQILNQRIEYALTPNSVDTDVIQRISEYASHFGNARLAIDLLRTSAELADYCGDPKITLRVVEDAITSIEAKSAEETINNLPTPHKLLLIAIEKISRMQPANFKIVHKLWGNLLAEKGLPAFTIWKFYDTINDLKKLDLLSTDKVGRGRGKGFESILTIPLHVKELMTKIGEKNHPTSKLAKEDPKPIPLTGA